MPVLIAALLRHDIPSSIGEAKSYGKPYHIKGSLAERIRI